MRQRNSGCNCTGSIEAACPQYSNQGPPGPLRAAEARLVVAAQTAERDQELGAFQYVHGVQLDGAHLAHQAAELLARRLPATGFGPRMA